jgi:DNA-binding transcriptional LysR family regulator
MRLSQLETFLAVARYKNFSKASQVCHLVQSTISHQISSLEEELGFALFERDSHTVTLTPAGEHFQRDIEEPLEMLRQAARRAQSVAAGETGSLTVGVSGMNQTDRFSSVRRFRERNPGVALSYRRAGNQNIFKQLDDGIFDVALIKIPEDLAPEYTTVDVRLERLYIVAARNHPASAHTRLSVEEAFRYPVLHARNGDLSDEENKRSILHMYGVEDADPNNVILMEDMDIMQLMLESGEGIAPVPESIIGYEQTKLKVIEFTDPPAPISVGWVYRTDNPNPVLHRFATYLSKPHSR